MHLPLLDPLFNIEADACWQVLWQAVASGCGRWRIGWPLLRAWLASRCLRCPRLLAFACKEHVHSIGVFFIVRRCVYLFIYFFFVGRGVLIVIWR